MALAKKTSVLREAMLFFVEPRRFGASEYVPEAMLCEQCSEAMLNITNMWFVPAVYS